MKVVIDSRMPDKKRKNLRIVCLCGQRMKITPAMYGKAAKCVSCRQKFFLPESDEISPGTGIIDLKDHQELLRSTGVFERVASPNITNSTPAQDPTPELESNLTPTPHRPLLKDSFGSRKEKNRSSLRGTPAPDAALDNSSNRNSSNPDSPDSSSPIRLRDKIPFDILEPLRLLCSYQHAVDELSQDDATTGHSATEGVLIDAYRRSLDTVWNRLRDLLKKAHESAQRQLTGIEAEINRITVALRVGEIRLSHYIKQCSQLRFSRENLIRFDHHLLAWQQIKDPFLSGGLLEVDLDAFDAESFSLELPPCPTTSASESLLSLYSHELCDAMRTRSGIELHLEEWKHMMAARPESGSSDDITFKEFTAAHTRIEAALHFYRQRLQALLSDSGQDLDAFHKYRRDILERDRKGQIKGGAKDGLLRDIEKAEDTLVRMEAQIRKTLHANSPMEVPTPVNLNASLFLSSESRTLRFYELFFYLLSIIFFVPGLLLLFRQEPEVVSRLLLLFSIMLALAQPSILFAPITKTRFPVAAGLGFAQALLIFIVLMSSSEITSSHFMIGTLPGLDVVAILFVSGFLFSGTAIGIIGVFNSNYDFSYKLLLVAICAVFMAFLAVLSFTLAPTGEERAPYTDHISTTFTLPDDSEYALGSPSVLSDPIPDSGTETDSERSESEPGTEDSSNDNDEGEASHDAISHELADIHRIQFSLIGVVHREGTPPRFRALIQSFDGNQTALTLQLGDTIAGDWKALEYNSEDKKLTISNGKKLLLLSAGDQVAIDDQLSEIEGESSS